MFLLKPLGFLKWSHNSEKHTDALLHREVYRVNPFKPEFTIVILIHYKPRIAVPIGWRDDLKWKVKN